MTDQPAKPLKAYAILEDCENTGGIIFAAHSIVALRRGASQFGDGDITGWAATRAPWADSYAPGPVPSLVCIDNGWHFECHGCGVNIDSDCEDFDVEPGEPVRLLKPVEDGHGIFCAEECRDRYLIERTERKIYEQWMLDLVRARLRIAVPGAVEVVNPASLYPHVHVEKKHGLWILRSAVLAFTFPGATVGVAHLRMDDETPGANVTVCQGDLAAWEAWRGNSKAAA